MTLYYRSDSSLLYRTPSNTRYRLKRGSEFLCEPKLNPTGQKTAGRNVWRSLGRLAWQSGECSWSSAVDKQSPRCQHDYEINHIPHITPRNSLVTYSCFVKNYINLALLPRNDEFTPGMKYMKEILYQTATPKFLRHINWSGRARIPWSIVSINVT